MLQEGILLSMIRSAVDSHDEQEIKKRKKLVIEILEKEMIEKYSNSYSEKQLKREIKDMKRKMNIEIDKYIEKQIQIRDYMEEYFKKNVLS